MSKEELKPKYTYKGITFAKGFRANLADFKEAFGLHQDFKLIPHVQREKELKRVHGEVLKHTKKVEKAESDGTAPWLPKDDAENDNDNGNTETAEGESSSD